MVLGMVEVTTAWWYEIVLYGGNGVGRPIGDFNRWCPSSSFMNMCSIFSVARYGKVKTVGSTSIPLWCEVETTMWYSRGGKDSTLDLLHAIIV
jgi:hypothetical protein